MAGPISARIRMHKNWKLTPLLCIGFALVALGLVDIERAAAYAVKHGMTLSLEFER